MLSNWLLPKIEAVKDAPRVLIRDPLQILSPEAVRVIHQFAGKHNFTLIKAATNLAFRQLYEQVIADPEIEKILVIDLTPMSRRKNPSITKAPPPFYPDFLADMPDRARVDLDLRQFLKEKTGDQNWPLEVNDPRYARLIIKNLNSVLRAHQNLRVAHIGRFTDHDFKTIVAYAALGVADAAFKKLKAMDYWRIGLLAHEALKNLDVLAPEITKSIKEKLEKAPPPFCWFADYDPDLVIRAFYLSAILAQHTKQWNILLANIDPSLAPLSAISPEILYKSAPALLALDPQQAEQDLKAVEESLSSDSLRLILLEQMNLPDPVGFTEAIEKEKYSTFIRALALLMALDNLISNQPAQNEQNRIFKILFHEGDSRHVPGFIETRSSVVCSCLKEAYRLASKIQPLRDELSKGIKTLKVVNVSQLSIDFFYQLWNGKRVNRIEYYLSALERLVNSSVFLPRPENELPSIFGSTLGRVRKRIKFIIEEANKLLDVLNYYFQKLIAAQYPRWINSDSKICFTCHFLEKCLKPHWDPQKEKAVVFIFDGMRYDIWAELLRPMLEDIMEIEADLPAMSLLPSETSITRKAICAGTRPDECNLHQGEDKLLRDALSCKFNYTGQVEIIGPDGAGVGEVVRYRAGNLEVYIFDLCDRELHKIPIKKLSDGSEVSSRPLAFIYQQHIKNIIDTEVMAVVRGLSQGTKVFITADHGFGRVHRKKIPLEVAWLNEAKDCTYLNALLRESLEDLKAPAKIKEAVLEFPVNTVGLPLNENTYDQREKRSRQKQYATIIFPKTGYALSRPGAPFNPDAYTHGGISIQEMIIPMVALRIRAPEEGIISLDEIQGPYEILEGEEIEFCLILNRVSRGKKKMDEIRVDAEAAYSRQPDLPPLPHQVLYIMPKGAKVVYRFKPDTNEAQDDERRKGTMERTLTITVSYREGHKTIRKSRTRRFIINLNSERVIRRVPTHLGNILGLTPKSMR